MATQPHVYMNHRFLRSADPITQCIYLEPNWNGFRHTHTSMEKVKTYNKKYARGEMCNGSQHKLAYTYTHIFCGIRIEVNHLALIAERSKHTIENWMIINKCACTLCNIPVEWSHVLIWFGFLCIFKMVIMIWKFVLIYSFSRFTLNEQECNCNK